jgi:2-polyprenyl-6-methoxyphenol hydroxylase-like FAD-dependent oxidoreductase
LTARVLNIAIAGGGPGGLAAALALHRQGHKTVIYEQFDQPRPIGSGLILQPTGLGVLDWLGFGARMRSLGARIDRLYGTSSATGKTVLNVRYDALGSDRGLAVHRAALFNVLYDAVLAEGISFETGSQINDFSSGTLKLDQGRQTPRFDLVVDVLGARSPLRRCLRGVTREKQLSYGAIWASLPWPAGAFDRHALEQRYHNASVMIGVLPIGRMDEGAGEQAAFFWSLKTADHDVWKKQGLSAWKADVLRHWPETETLLSSVQSAEGLTLARYQHHTVAKPWGDRLISIGDSAHSTSPQLGQGANNALLDVMALAGALQTQACFEDVAKDYAHRRKWHVQTYQALSAMFTPFYQSDSRALAFIRDAVVSPMSRLPLAQRLLARMVSGTLVQPLRQGLTSELHGDSWNFDRG